MNIFVDQIISEALFNDTEESAKSKATKNNNNNNNYPIIGAVIVLLTFNLIGRRTQRRIRNKHIKISEDEKK